MCAPGGAPALRFGVQGVPACVTVSAVGQGTPNLQRKILQFQTQQKISSCSRLKIFLTFTRFTKSPNFLMIDHDEGSTSFCGLDFARVVHSKTILDIRSKASIVLKIRQTLKYVNVVIHRLKFGENVCTRRESNPQPTAP